MSQLDDLETIDFIEILQNDEDIKTLAKNDPRQIIEEFFYIANKDGLRVPFVFNEAQDIYYKNKTARDDILKARKEGFSSLILALLTVAFLFGENVNCVCISHEEESTQRLFKKVEYYIENMTTHDGKRIEVKLKDKSRKNLVFSYSKKTKDHNGNIIKEKITNTFYLGTAGAKAFGRGDTIHYLHCSEIAFWENASRLMTGLLNAVPDNLQNTYIVKESTANGVGTQHHKEWLNEQENKSVFKPHFFGWYQDPTNAMSLDKYLEAMHSVFILNTEDILTAAKYRLNDDQLAWRNYKISSMQPDDSHTKEELFQQEYPIDWKEAFLASGKPIFKLEVLKWYEEACVIPPLKVGELVGWRPAIFIENENERLKIWEDPVHDHEYVIAADVAEVGDFCYATVINRTTFKQVAEWHGKMDEFEYAGMLYKLGYYYNIALIGVERNNQGVAVVKKLMELEYPNQYLRETIDEITKQTHNEYGWRTDGTTRPIMISAFNQSITKRQYIIRSQLVIDQMRTFVRNKRGRAEAQSGSHDDAVIGNCIGIQLYEFLPEPIKDDEITGSDYKPNSSLLNYTKIQNG